MFTNFRCDYCQSDDSWTIEEQGRAITTCRSCGGSFTPPPAPALGVIETAPAELRCNYVAETRRYGVWPEPHCILEIGHSGSHVGVAPDGSQTGFQGGIPIFRAPEPETPLACQLREAIDFARTISRFGNPLDERHLDRDEPETIGSASEDDGAVDTYYSHDVFLLWDAIAKLARCRYVIRNRRGIMVDTNMLCDGDVIVFDRVKWQRMGGGR